MCQTLDTAKLNLRVKERRLQPSLISATICAFLSLELQTFFVEKKHIKLPKTRHKIFFLTITYAFNRKNKKKVYSFTHNEDELSVHCIVVFASYEVPPPSYRFLTAQMCTVHSFLSVLVGMHVGNITLFILAFVLPFPERWCYAFRDALRFLRVREAFCRAVYLERSQKSTRAASKLNPAHHHIRCFYLHDGEPSESRHTTRQWKEQKRRKHYTKKMGMSISA